MIHRVEPLQIPQLWDIISFTASKTHQIEKKHLPAFLSDLLSELLCSKSLCYVVRKEEKRVDVVILMRVEISKLYDYKSLNVYSLYAYRLGYELEKIWEFIKGFAQKSGCSKIYFESDNKKLHELAESVGFEESCRRYTYNL